MKINDFGAASFLIGKENVHHEELVTTYEYCAPEQTHLKPFDSKADVFAAGSIMYELSTGELAFSGHHAQTIFASIQSDEYKPELPPHFSKPAKNLFKSLHEKNPQDRPSTAEALEHEWFQYPNTNCVEWCKTAIQDIASLFL